MSNIKRQDLIEKKLSKYNEKEFFDLINTLDNKDLIEPIKKNSKRFSQDTKGWRIDRLDKNKLREIYFKYIYKKRDNNLAQHLLSILNKNTLEIKERIKLELCDIEDIKLRLENYDKEFIEKMIDLLLDTTYSMNILLYFKVMDIELREEISSYLEDVSKIKRVIKDEKIKITNEINYEFNEKLKQIERNKNEIIKVKEREIKELNFEIDKIGKKLALDIEKKEIEVLKLKNNYISREKNLKLEIDKLNSKVKDSEQRLEKVVFEREELEKINIKKEEEIKELSCLCENKYDMFDKYAKTRWQKENKDLELKNKEIQQDICNLKIYKLNIEEEILKLKKDEENIRSIINSLENKSKEFIDNISYVINRVEKTKAIQENINREKSELSSSIHHIESKVIEIDPDIKKDKFDFIEELADNFECMGIGNNYVFYLAKYVYATIASEMGLLVVGYNNRMFAHVISYTINNSSADIIVIPPGFTDSEQLIKIVNNLKSKVILIENAIDNIAESVYIPLLKQNREKILIFSVESSENLNVIPKGVFNYLIPIALELILESDKIEGLYSCITPDDIFKYSNDNKMRKSKLLDSFNEFLDFGNITKIKMAKINNIINEFDSESNSKSGIYSLLLFSIGMILKSQNKFEQLESFIKKQNFDDEKLNNLDIITGIGKQYE